MRSGRSILHRPTDLDSLTSVLLLNRPCGRLTPGLISETPMTTVFAPELVARPPVIAGPARPLVMLDPPLAPIAPAAAPSVGLPIIDASLGKNVLKFSLRLPPSFVTNHFFRRVSFSLEVRSPSSSSTLDYRHQLVAYSPEFLLAPYHAEQPPHKHLDPNLSPCPLSFVEIGPPPCYIPRTSCSLPLDAHLAPSPLD